MSLLTLFDDQFFDQLNIGEITIDLSQFRDLLETPKFKEEKQFGPYKAVLTKEQNGDIRYQVDLYDERKQNPPDIPKFLAARKSFNDFNTAIKTYIALFQSLPRLE